MKLGIGLGSPAWKSRHDPRPATATPYWFDRPCCAAHSTTADREAGRLSDRQVESWHTPMDRGLVLSHDSSPGCTAERMR